MINVLHGPVAELQKLGVVPQTVFVGTRAAVSEAPSVYAATTTTRRSTLDVTPRPSNSSVPKAIQRANIDITSRSASPYEDLQRHLRQIEGSPLGLSVPQARVVGRKDSHSSLASGSGVHSPAVTDPASDAPTLDFAPPSPSESVSVLSSTHGGDMLRRHLRHLVQDVQKTAPTIASVKTVATGTLEAPLKQSDVSASGRTSPASTVRGGDQRPRLRSAAPSSSLAFGKSGFIKLSTIILIVGVQRAREST